MTMTWQHFQKPYKITNIITGRQIMELVTDGQI